MVECKEGYAKCSVVLQVERNAGAKVSERHRYDIWHGVIQALSKLSRIVLDHLLVITS